MTARHHHFLSQCYLRGFTNNGSKKSKLRVINVADGTHFETKPRNVGGIRDFNRIDAEGVDQNILEKSLADFEGEAATAIKALVEGEDFSGERREIVLYLIGLLAIRSPHRREQMRTFQAQIIERVMDLSLDSKERWDFQIEGLRMSGGKVLDNVTYEDVKRFHESKAYTIQVAREHHIRIEMSLLQTIVPLLSARNWSLIRSDDDSGSFITTDRPVLLEFEEPENVPAFYRRSPGFGLDKTYLYFPVSKHVSLLGQFSERQAEMGATRTIVASLNSAMLGSVYRQVYAPGLDFPVMSADGKVISGKALVK